MKNNLEIGKLPNDVLENLILKKIENFRKEVIVGSSLGEDTAILDFENDYIVLSCDPITGADSNLGKLGVHISVNDISTSAAEPVGILLTLLLPPFSTVEDITEIMTEVQQEVKLLGIDIIGGHTEVTEAVSKPLLVSTVVGRVNKKHLPNRSQIRPGYVVAMSKTAGLEGTAIIANDKKNELLNVINPDEIDEAIEQFKNISVFKEGILSRKYFVGYMHDVTESGIEGALWEASKAIGFGLHVKKEDIPILKSTQSICQFYNIDPYKLISSGSMLIIIDEKDFKNYQNDLLKEGINCTQIGVVSENAGLFYVNENGYKEIQKPGVDELYKVI